MNDQHQQQRRERTAAYEHFKQLTRRAVGSIKKLVRLLQQEKGYGAYDPDHLAQRIYDWRSDGFPRQPDGLALLRDIVELWRTATAPATAREVLEFYVQAGLFEELRELHSLFPPEEFQAAFIAVTASTVLPEPEDDPQLVAGLARLQELPFDQLPEPDVAHVGWYLADERQPTFVGRGERMPALVQVLLRTRRVVIAAGAGMGKTTLAREISYRYGRYFAGGVFWLAAERQELLEQDMRNAGGQAGMGLEEHFESLPAALQLQQVRVTWSSKLPRLIVLDNCENPDLLDVLALPENSGCHILITSRNAHWPPGCAVESLTEFTRAESLELLHRLTPDLDAGSAAGTELCELLGDMPLTISLAGHYLQETATPIAAYLHAIRAADVLLHPSQGAASARVPDYAHQNLSRALEISLAVLDPEETIDRRALRIAVGIAHLAPGEAVSLELAAAICGGELAAFLQNDTPDARGYAQARRRLQRASGLLSELGLVTVAATRPSIRMHRLVAAYLRAAPQGIDGRGLAVAALERVLDRCGYNLAAWSAQAPHLMALLETVSRPESSEASRLYTRAARYYELSGNWKAMLSFARQAFEAGGDRAAMPRSERLRRRLDYAGSLQYQGKHLAAVEMFQQALPLLGTADEEEDLLAEFGISAVLIGRIAEGLAAVRRALAMQQRRYRENSRSLQPQFGDHAGRMLRKLAYCLAHAGQYRAARRCAEAALPRFWNEQPLPEGDIAQTLFILGLIGNFQACHQDAERFHRESLRHRMNVYAPGQSDPFSIIHTEIGESLDGIGLALLGQGRIDEARRYLEAAFNISRQDRTGIPHDPLRYSALGMLAVATNDLPAARHYFSYTYEIIKADCGPGNYWCMEARAHLGLIALRQGRRSQAEELFTEPWQQLLRNAPRHPLLARINGWLAQEEAHSQIFYRVNASTLQRSTSNH